MLILIRYYESFSNKRIVSINKSQILQSKGGIIIKQLFEKQDHINYEIKNLEEQLLQFPPGYFNIVNNGKYSQWRYFIDGKEHYIPKSQRDFAEKLAIKKYLQCKLDDLKAELQSLNAYINTFNSKFKNKSDQLLEDKPYQELLSNYFKSTSQEIDAWLKEDFTQSNEFPEHLKIKCKSGNIVRSKSEQLIDLLLYQYKIPFRYECQLILNGHIIYPDFTLMRPRDGKIMYWEHFGKIDDPMYLHNNRFKIEEYFSNGIIPYDNLIMTFETLDHPLDIHDVEKLIQTFIL